MSGRAPLRVIATIVALVMVWLVPLLPLRAADARLASPIGLWQPLDSAGRPLGLIHIFEANGLYYGRIEASLRAMIAAPAARAVPTSGVASRSLASC